MKPVIFMFGKKEKGDRAIVSNGLEWDFRNSG